MPAEPPAIVHRARDFATLTEEGKNALTQLMAEFWQTEDPDRRSAILEEIEASRYGEELLAFVAKLLGLKDESTRLRAVELLAGNTAAAILPILDRALADPSEAVRMSAVAAVAQVRDDAVVGYLGKVFEDASENVRLAGLDVLESQTQDRKLKVLGRALQATHSDVQTAAIGALQLESTPQSVEVLFDALDASDREVRQEAQFSIDFLVDREFSSAAEARTWWKENKEKFDRDLVLKE